ncbi:MAG: 4Fe-4S domain-containing protein, partial [Acidimicrobiales bacterium]
MARIEDRHPAGAPGDWFVDNRCFDCDAARQVAPGLIERNPNDGVSYFVKQPETPEEIEMAWLAVQVCPTRSVGHVDLRRPEQPVFPQDLGDHVFRLGHNSKDSFGAHSYLVARAGGNLMIDAPRWTREAYEPLDEMGGLAHVLLSHSDDVADAERYSQRYGARVWIHADDASAAPYASDLIEGENAVTITDGVIAFPVPGHTKGSVLYLVDEHLLFSGDSLAWNPGREQLSAFRRACWYSWEAQT